VKKSTISEPGIKIYPLAAPGDIKIDLISMKD